MLLFQIDTASSSTIDAKRKADVIMDGSWYLQTYQVNLQ